MTQQQVKTAFNMVYILVYTKNMWYTMVYHNKILVYHMTQQQVWTTYKCDITWYIPCKIWYIPCKIWYILCDIPYFLVYTMVYYTFFIHVIQYGIPKLPAALAPTCLASICAGHAMCWAVCHWCRATCVETSTPRCPIGLEIVMELSLIPAGAEATEVGQPLDVALSKGSATQSHCGRGWVEA